MVQMRWLETKEAISGDVGFWHTVRTLQYRYQLEDWKDDDYSTLEDGVYWSGWKDPPTVTAIQAKGAQP